MTNAIIGTVDWSNDYKNVLSVSSTHRQDIINHMNLSYHHSPVHINDFSIIKIDSFNATLRIDGDYSAISKHNYIIFKNSEMSENVYAFINSITFENPQQTLYLHLTIDLWQQYGGSVRFKKSFIERQHIAKSADSWRRWQAPEPVNVSFNDETILLDTTTNSGWARRWVLEAVSKAVGNIPDRHFEYEGTGNGQNYYGLYGWGFTTEEGTASGIQNIVNRYKPTDTLFGAYSQFKMDDLIDHRKDIAGVHQVPAFALQNVGHGNQLTANILASLDLGSVTFSQTALANGYVPKNKKLFGALCRAGLVFNKNGIKKNINPYKITENTISLLAQTKPMGTNTIIVTIGGYTPNENTLSIPYYSSTPIAYNENTGVVKGLNIAKCVGGAVDEVLSLGGAVATVGASGGGAETAGALAGSGAGGLVNGLIDSVITNPMLASADITATTGNASDGLTTTPAYVGLKVAEINPPVAQCEMIDDYLERYGYAINEIETPSVSSRSNWNYLKGDISFTVNATNDVKNQLKSIFANGFTVWHNYATMLDYSQNNN